MKPATHSTSTILLGLALLLALLPAGPAAAQGPAAPPTLGLVFAPDTIGPGSTTQAVFTIDNTANATPVEDLAFTMTWPPGVTNQTPMSASSTCTGGVLTASPGGSSISLSGGEVGGSASCTVTVDVTSSSAGTHTATSGDLTSSAGNSGTATDDLTVATDRPGFSKSFDPVLLDIESEFYGEVMAPAGRPEVLIGHRRALRFEIDNSDNPSPVSFLSFRDVLPPGLAFADPADVYTSCGSSPIVLTLTITPPGTLDFSYNGNPFFPAVAANSTCVVIADVVGTAVGLQVNRSELLRADDDEAGFAAAWIEVLPTPLVKEFIDDPVPAGGDTTLQFRITNPSRDEPLTLGSPAFTDDLAAMATGFTVSELPAEPCGVDSTVTGTTVIELSGGTIAPGSSCTFDVLVTVPDTPGAYNNVTSDLTATPGNPETEGGDWPGAADTVFVTAAPRLTIEFTDDPVAAGGTVTLSYTIEDISGDGATNVAFADELTGGAGDGGGSKGFLPFPLSLTLPGGSPCGGTVNVVSFGTERQGISFSGGTLTAGEICSFDVLVDIPAGFPSGTYTNTTEAPTATVNANPETGLPASDVAEIVGGPTLTKEFIDDPVAPGEPVTLQFTLSHDELAPGSASGVAFTDDLTATAPGLLATGLPVSGCGGTLSSADGGETIDFAGGALNPGEECTFGVMVTTDAGLTPQGIHTNTTSDVTASVEGLATTSPPAEDDLLVAALTLTKEFVNDPVVPGGTVDLTFTLTNDGGEDATNVFFDDDLDNVLDGMTANWLPMSVCDGIASGLDGNTLIRFTGGSVAAGTDCSFTVELNIPASAVPDTYVNTTSGFRADFGDGLVSLPNARDELAFVEPPSLTKEFLDDPVPPPGGTVDLVFTLLNPNTPEGDLTGLAFTDNLGVMLLGTTAALGDNSCDGTVDLTDPSVVDYSGGSLSPGAECSFTVTLTLPAGETGTFTNTTSPITSDSVDGDTASDDLTIAQAAFDKAFSGAAQPGDPVTLTFTIENNDPVNGLTDVAFTDDLDAVLPGLIATGLPLDDVCGVGSQITGAGFLTLTGGTLDPDSSCTFDVPVRIPRNASDGDYLNVTSELRAGAQPVADQAEATLTVLPATPTTPDPDPRTDLAVELSPAFQDVGVGGDAALTATVTNNGPAAGDGTLHVVLPSGVTGSGPTGCTDTDTGFSCDFDEIDVDGTATFELITSHPNLGTDTITVEVDGTNDDPDSSNNTASADVEVLADLIGTSIEVSQQRFITYTGLEFAQADPVPADWAVIGRDDLFADSLAGTVLTGNGPLLYTESESLDPRVSNELQRVLGDEGGTVYLLGGEAALSPAVHDAIEALGLTVIRLAGASRVETSVAVADEALRLIGEGTLPDPAGMVGIARANAPEDNPTAAWVDSVTAGAWTATTGTPLLLTQTEFLHPAVAEWLGANSPDTATLLGGTAALSEDVETDVSGLVATVDRVQGGERAATAVAVAETLLGVGPDGPRHYVIVGGFADDGWAYGLLAGGVAEDNNGAILLSDVDTIPDATLAAVTSCEDEPVDLQRLGDPEQVSDATMATLDAQDDAAC